MIEERPLGICCHEAGHAIVAESVGIPIEAIHVTFTEEKGWYGYNESKESDCHLPFTDRITILIAGKTAEEVFERPAHDKAWGDDAGKIALLLLNNEIPETEHCTQINNAKERARPILESQRQKVLDLTDWLFRHGNIYRSEFLRLMD
jgi:hypothetical protein